MGLPTDGDRPKLAPKTPDQLISLLSAYAGQYASYTTLLWQVPALSLTAQAFLLTLALGYDTGHLAKVIAAALSGVISAASYALMHDQRGHATIDVETGDQTDAEAVWLWRGRSEVIPPRAGRMYAVWKACMLIFLFVDVGIIASVVMPVGAAAGTAAFLAAVSTVVILVTTRRSVAGVQDGPPR
jgi:hypothetical protein